MIHTFGFPRPGALMNLNDRLHHMARARLTKQWRTAACRAAEATTIRGLGRCLVRLDLPVKSNCRRDPHNWAPTVKACVDGCVDAGVWPDDHAGFVVIEEPSFHKGGSTVTITLTEIPV